MRFHAIATDYDGTLARNGRAEPATLAALERVRASGRKLLLVTGRELDSLQSVFSQLQLFDRILAENGALLYDPATKKERSLCPSPSDDFVAALRQRGVPVSMGKCIVATVKPYDTAVAQAIRELGLDLHVIFNKEAVMVLPGRVDKSTGLSAALTEMGLSSQTVVGIGDAENDHEFLSFCDYSVAVANAIPALKRRAKLVTSGSYGSGVIEVIDQLMATGRLP